VRARSRLILVAALLTPGAASAHDFRSLGYAVVGFFAIHASGLIPWWRAWRLSAKVIYVLSFPVVLLLGFWLVNTFPILDALGVLVVIWCAPALASIGTWVYRRSNSHAEPI
jgi:hypothetical protein